MRSLRSLAVVAAVIAVVACTGCAGGSERAVARREAPEPSVARAGGRSPLADLVVELAPATYDEREHRAARPAPASLRIERLDVAANVTAVGVEPDGELAVPGPSEVGWYRHGPTPGKPGTAVLAAHVAYDGVDGVFRHLDDLDRGDAVVVSTGDGADQTFRVDDVTLYPKNRLPDELWSREGAARLALVTCGGSFDRTRRSYDSNVVVWASPA